MHFNVIIYGLFLFMWVHICTGFVGSLAFRRYWIPLTYERTQTHCMCVCVCVAVLHHDQYQTLHRILSLIALIRHQSNKCLVLLMLALFSTINVYCLIRTKILPTFKKNIEGRLPYLIRYI